MSEPATTAQLARRGELVGTAEDVLIVATLLRCGRDGQVLGAVLHLDRTARRLPPMLLAELGQCDLGRRVRPASKAGQVSRGDRLAELDAVPLPPPAGALASRVLVDCPGEPMELHELTVRELIDWGRDGADYMRGRMERGLPPRPREVRVDRVTPYLSPSEQAAIRSATTRA